jgi:hypothetical protein
VFSLVGIASSFACGIASSCTGSYCVSCPCTSCISSGITLKGVLLCVHRWWIWGVVLIASRDVGMFDSVGATTTLWSRCPWVFTPCGVWYSDRILVSLLSVSQ